MSNTLSQKVRVLATVLASGAIISVGLGTSAFAQTNWPERPVKLIVGYPAGGPVDVTGRTFARFLGEQLKQSVVVENRAGASGMLGADATAKATPDGYTLNFIASPTMTISPIVQRTKLFDPRQDFTMLGSVVNYTNVLLSQDRGRTRRICQSQSRQSFLWLGGFWGLKPFIGRTVNSINRYNDAACALQR